MSYETSTSYSACSYIQFAVRVNLNNVPTHCDLSEKRFSSHLFGDQHNGAGHFYEYIVQ